MAAVVVEAISYVLQCLGVCCLCVARLVEWVKQGLEVFTKVATCGQGWQGLFLNFLTLFNSEEDPDFKDFHLPEAEDRGMTDLPCLVLFLTVLLGMMASMNRAIAYGRPEVYFQGMDSWGNVCGYENVAIHGSIFSGKDMTKFDKLLIFDFLSRTSVLTSEDVAAMSEITSTTSICVQNCPLITRTFNCWEFLGIQSSYPKVIQDLLCKSAERELVDVRVKTLSFTERNSRCVPEVITESISVEKQNEMLNLYSSSWVHNLIADCHTCAAELTWITLIAAAFALLFICVIQSSADNICWFSFASFSFVGMISSASLWYMYYGISARDTSTVLYSEGGDPDEHYASWNDTVTSKARAGYIGADSETSVPQAGYSVVFRDTSLYVTFVTVFFTIICCLVGKQNMDTSAILFKVAIAAMSKVRWIYILPIVTLCSISFATGLFLYTVNLLTAVFMDEILITEDPVYRFPKAKLQEDHVYTNWVLLFEFIAFAWLFCFITSCQTLISSGAIASWYYIKDKEDLDRPLRISSTRLIRCHLGSAAAGGFLVGFLGWMRAPFSFLQSRLNRAVQARENEPSMRSSLYSGYSKHRQKSDYDYEQGSGGVEENYSKTDAPPISQGPRTSEYSDTGPSGAYSRSFSGTENPHGSEKSRGTQISAYSEGSGSKKSSGPKPTLKMPLKYLQCIAQALSPFFWIQNNLLVYISDVNFSIVALKGLSFFQAGFAVRDILVNDPKLKGLGAISSYTLFLGKLSVVMVVLPFGFLFLRDKEGVFVYGYPMAMGAAVSFVVAHVFFSLFNATVGTIFACLMEDRALNDGSEGKPFFGPKALIMKFHKILEEEDSSDEPDFWFAIEFPRPEHKKRAAKLAKNSEPGSESEEALYDEEPKSKGARKQPAENTSSVKDHSSMFLLMPKKDAIEKGRSLDDFHEEDEGQIRTRETGKKRRTDSRKPATKSNKESDRISQKIYQPSSYSNTSHVHRREKLHYKKKVERSSSESGGLLGNLFDEALNRRDESDDDGDFGEEDVGDSDGDMGDGDDPADDVRTNISFIPKSSNVSWLAILRRVCY